MLKNVNKKNRKKNWKFWKKKIENFGKKLKILEKNFQSRRQILTARGVYFSITNNIKASLICSFITEQVSKRPGRYDEMPKSATMENRQNMEQHVRIFVHLLNTSSLSSYLLLSSTRQCSDKRTRAWLRFRAATRWTPVLDNQLLKYD